MTKEESVCIIIFDEDKRVLLTKRRDIPVWILPGGGIDANECPEEAAVREGCEETACQIQLIRKIATYLPVNKMTRTTHFFEAKIASGSPHATDETKECAFFSLDALPVMPPPYRGWIHDALQTPHGVVLTKKIEGVNYFVLLMLFIKHPLLVSRYLLTKIGIHING